MKRLRTERGQAAVLTVIFLAALLGAVAMVLDVGSWFREQRGAQSAADAAALAGAQALPESTGTSSALASQYLAANGGGSGEYTWSTTRFANDTITVKVERQAPGFFAKLFGIDSVDVHAKASARAGTVDRARWAAPIGVDVKHPMLQCGLSCFGSQTTLDLEKVGPGAFRLINLDGSRGGTGPPILADWIQRGFDGYMPLGWYYSDPGAKFNSSQVKNAMDARIGDELLFPVYDLIRGNGANLEYHVIGWVGFLVTGYTFKGSKGTVSGKFVRVIWEGILSESGGNKDFGVRAIELTE